MLNKVQKDGYKLVYEVNHKNKQGYGELKNENFPTKPSKGLNYKIFSNGEEVVVAFRGTEMNTFADLATDSKLFWGALGKKTPVADQAYQAIEVMEKIKELQEKGLLPKKVTVTGHSLGGHISNFVGRAYPDMVDKVVGFNSAFNKDFAMPLHDYLFNADSEVKRRAFQNVVSNTREDNVYNFVGKSSLNIISAEEKQYNLIKLSGDSHKMGEFWQSIALQNLLVQSGFSLKESTDYLVRQFEKNRWNSTGDIAAKDLQFILSKTDTKLENSTVQEFLKGYDNVLEKAKSGQIAIQGIIDPKTKNAFTGFVLPKSSREEGNITQVKELEQGKRVCGKTTTNYGDGSRIVTPQICDDNDGGLRP